MTNGMTLAAARIAIKELIEIVDNLTNQQITALAKKLFDEELVDKQGLVERLTSVDAMVFTEALQYLEATSVGSEIESSGLDVISYVQADYEHSDIYNDGVDTHSYFDSYAFFPMSTWQYVLPAEEVIIPQIDSPPQPAPDPDPEPRPTGTLSATFSYEGNQVELFSDYTVRNLNEIQLFTINGQLIQYSVTDVNVNLLSLGAWDNLKSIAFKGDAYDLQSKQLNFINFAHVDIDFFSYPPYAQLSELAANVNIEGANRGDVTLTDQNDTLEISHTNLANGAVTNFEINTLGGDDYVLLKPSSFQYVYQSNVNDNSGSNIRATINTGDGNDRVDSVNSLSRNIINLGDGNDIAYSGDGKDKILGGDGNDTIHAGDGNDIIKGGNGNDILDGGAGIDTIRGGAGNDTLIVAAGDKLFGDGGNDTFTVGNNVLAGSYRGGSGNDTLLGDGHSINIRLTDKLTTANSIESIQGQSGDNYIIAGDNKVNWNFTNTSIHSNIKSISGSDKNDKITGSTGNDTIFGHDGKDTIDGGKGNDQLTGGAGNDRIDGGVGTDTAHLSQDFNQYSFSYNALTQTLTMTNNVDGKDKYQNIEWFEFGDVTKSWSDIVNNIPPIVLDLDGDGVEYSDELVAFDADGDGQNELMFWAGDDDGILTFDKDNNQEVSDASEISFTRYLEGAKTDLQGLKAFDSDGNDIFDANDASWQQFGVTTNDEFYSLSDLGIQSIELSSDNNAQQIKPGVVEYGQGVYHNEDGSSGVFADVAFDYQQVFSDESNSMELLLENLPEQEAVDQATIANAEAADKGAQAVVAAPIEETLSVEIPPANIDV